MSADPEPDPVTVTPDNVRLELGGVSSYEVPDSVVTYHLEKAERSVTAAAPASLFEEPTEGMLDDAVAVEAAYRVLVSIEDTYHESSSDVNLSDDYNVEARIQTMKERRQEARSSLGSGGDGPRAELI